MTVELSRPTYVGSHLRLQFSGLDSPDVPIETFASLLSDIGGLYIRCFDDQVLRHADVTQEFLSLEDPHERRNLRLLHVAGISFASPLEILLDVPFDVWRLGIGTLFVGGMALIFNIPGRYQEARHRFWHERLEAEKDKQAWTELTATKYENSPITLDELIVPDDARDLVPPEPEDD